MLNIGLARGAQCVLLFSSLVGATACGPTVDLATGLEIDEISTGWLNAGVVDGKNKVVPAVTFKLKNVSDQKLSTLQVNALFRQVDSTEEWGSGFLTVAGSSGLAPGAETPPLMIKSPLGYTGSDQSRLEMLQNSHFKDAKVELFAKYGSVQWVRLGTYPITRQLLTK